MTNEELEIEIEKYSVGELSQLIDEVSKTYNSFVDIIAKGSDAKCIAMEFLKPIRNYLDLLKSRLKELDPVVYEKVMNWKDQY